MKILVTGGCGFIGSALVRHLLSIEAEHEVVNVDALTYAANPLAIGAYTESDRYCFERADIRDAGAVKSLLMRHRPDAIAHLAAETHVDRSIDGPSDFVTTNLVGTYNVLEAARAWMQEGAPATFRILHMSTDEVFGSLGPNGVFDSSSRYDPSSPYSATKAGSDHLVSAWRRTFGLPTLLVNMCNAYGPWQFPEKLIPLVTTNAAERKPLPIYGTGENVREWIYVADVARALEAVLFKGQTGESYMIGSGEERSNLNTVETICEILDGLHASDPGTSHKDLIRFVEDRPGHDGRYAVDSSKMQRCLGWVPVESFETGLEKTVRWYLENQEWWKRAKEGGYGGGRLGLKDGRPR